VVAPVECAGRRVVAVTDQIRTVARERLHERLAEVSASDLLAVETGVRRILDWNWTDGASSNRGKLLFGPLTRQNGF
jgi:hypothetical protein